MMFLAIILVSVQFFAVLPDPVVREQIGCAEGEPLAGEQEPDVNLTVLPSLTVPVLRPFSIICDAGVPRYSRVQLPPVGIIIYIGEHAVKKCNSPDGTTALNQCVYNSSSLFPEMPRLISCTAVNAERLCRFKTARITLDVSLLATTAPVSNETMKSTTQNMTTTAQNMTTTTLQSTATMTTTAKGTSSGGSNSITSQTLKLATLIILVVNINI